jgi:hypothetical protein
MKSFLSLLFVSSVLLTSCKKEVELQKNTAPTNIIPFTEVGKQMQNQSAISSQTQPDSNMINQNQALTAPTPVAKGMNPAHGQPTHRCDIPVGAPLNSPVATTTNKPATQQITPQQNQPVSISPATGTPTVTTPTPEGMNPPHGQENHRCDIAVGAPLTKNN